ncbi:MAG: Si-specific NAD(P)(+) transhydrogenase [Nitrospirota bacterium]|nr:MAG: Si-specific NAD(P)(+) transhydrogenase [Nitrospirota bacterium]
MNQTTYDYDILCIGSGPAGQRAAVQAAKLGKRAAVVEKRRIVGGICVDTGTIPSKTFRQAVVSLPDYTKGFQPSSSFDQDIQVSAAQVLGRIEHVLNTEAKVVEQQLRRNEVRLFRGEARFHDPHTVIVTSESGMRRVTAENILIAVGSVPTPPPGAKEDGQTLTTSDGLLQLKRLPRSLVVIGGGIIGIEYASIFSALGVEVTLVDKRDRPLEFLDHEIVDDLIHQMRKRDVTFRLGEAVEHIEISENPARRAVIHLESGKRLVSDLALFSIGRIGATKELNLETLGIESDARGRLSVDAQYRTKIPHIFAAGDVIGYPSLAATSADQGRLVACHAFGVPAEPMAEHFPIGIYAIPEISMVGRPEHILTAEKIPYEVGLARYREIARGQILGDDTGFFKMLFHREDRRLLGVHVIGTNATELVHIGQAVLGLGGGLDYFLNTVFNYPTLAECYKVAALDAANKLAL